MRFMQAAGSCEGLPCQSSRDVKPSRRAILWRMNMFLTVLLVLAMAATLGVMLYGMIGMARGDGDPMRSNRLMRWRVILQAATLVIVMLLVSLLKS